MSQHAPAVQPSPVLATAGREGCRGLGRAAPLPARALQPSRPGRLAVNRLPATTGGLGPAPVAAVIRPAVIRPCRALVSKPHRIVCGDGPTARRTWYACCPSTMLSGEVTIQMRDRDVVLGLRELFVVPRGAERCPGADTETAVLLLEPSNVVNTGDAGGAFTAEAETLSRRSPCGPIRMGRPVFRAYADQHEGGWPTVPAAR